MNDAQTSSRELQNRLRDIIRLTADLVWEADRDHRITSLSKNANELLGRHQSELVGSPLSDVWQLTDTEEGQEWPDWSKPFRELEVTFEMPDGEIRMFQLAGLPVFDHESGDFICVRGIAKDVTSKRRTEQALADSSGQLSEQSELLQATLDSIDQGFAVWDADDELIAWNKMCFDLWYRPANVRTGMPRRELFDHLAKSGGFGNGDWEEISDREFQRVTDSGHSSEEEFTMKDGRRIHVQRYPMTRGGYAAVYSDITQRVAAESKIIRSEARFRAIAEASGSGIFISPIDQYELLYCNSGAADMFRSTTDELKRIDPETWFVEPSDFKRLSREVRDKHRVERFEAMLKRVDGETMWGLISGERIEYGDQKAVLFLVTDIGHLKEVEDELRLARDEAELANRAKTEFLSRMSHELRTPLNAILGFAQLMHRDPNNPLVQEHQEGVEYILRSGRHLLDLITDILDFASIEAGKLEVGVESVELEELVGECLPVLAPMAGVKGISITTDLSRNLVVKADSTRLQQILLNLLSNAVKFNRTGGMVLVSADAMPNGKCRISVQDTGVGIPKEKWDGLFQAFNRLGAEKGEIAGTGVGLSICRQLIELMGGTIDFDSEVGVGSRFWIDIDLLLPAAVGRELHSAVGD